MRRQFPHANDGLPPRRKRIKKRPQQTHAEWLIKKRQWGRDWYKNNKGKVYIANGKWRAKAIRKLKYQVIEAYGGCCSCCGETEWGFLTIDHVNRNGRADRAKHRGRFWQLYGWLRANGFPKDGYRLLCMNCNWGSRHTGICPHASPIIALHKQPIVLNVA